MPPPDIVAQVVEYLPPKATTPEDIPETTDGVDLLVVVPSPNSPFALEPQQYTAPLELKTHE
jgi:hypothetical protein